MVRTKFSIERCRRSFIEVTFCWHSPVILSAISTPNQENYLFVHQTSLNHCAKRKKTKHLCRRLFWPTLSILPNRSVALPLLTAGNFHAFGGEL